MKIIFLDIDGVLNSNQWLRHRIDVLKRDRIYNGDFPKGTVNELNYLIEKYDFKIVISSSWREQKTIEELKHHFINEGIKSEIIGSTPILRNTRGNEIQKWLDETQFNIESYIILDDNNDMELLSENLVLIDSDTGLNANYRDQIMRIINKNQD